MPAVFGTLVDPDDDPAHPADVPVDGSRLRGRLADGAGRHGVRDVPDRAARHLPDVLYPGRVRLPGAGSGFTPARAGCARWKGGPDPRPRSGRAIAISWPDGVPWWRVAAAVMTGCAMSVKWSALWYIILFVVLIVLWEVGARRSAGVRVLGGHARGRSRLVGRVRAAIWSPCTCSAGRGWFVTSDGYDRQLVRSNHHGHTLPPVINALAEPLASTTWPRCTSTTRLTSPHIYQSWPGNGCCSADRSRSITPRRPAAAPRTARPRCCCWAPAALVVVRAGRRRCGGVRRRRAATGGRRDLFWGRSPASCPGSSTSSATGRCSTSTPYRPCRSSSWRWSICSVC